MALTTGSPAPDFNLVLSATQSVALSTLRGKHVVLYFYPKDDTPGCTQESCDFRDALPVFESKEAVIVGISRDGLESHEKFKAKYQLPFWLAADEGAKVCQLYGVWKEKNLYGKKSMGVERTTFLIDPQGIILRIWPKVKVESHAQEVLEALKN
ncbi:MAG: peroxiredoxin [Alphaproteobacteria bacterium]